MLALKQWRTETSIQLWNTAGVTRAMPENLVLPDCCLVALAKSEKLSNLTELIKFLEPWHSISKHAQKIFHCLEKNCPPLNSNAEPPKANLLSKTEQKLALQALRALKKKTTQDLLAAKEAQIVALRDQWHITQDKARPETKVRIKKMTAAEQKLLEKQEKARKKT